MTHIPHKPFPFCTGIRHALVESGVKIVGEAHGMALSAGAKFQEQSLPPVASISALKYSKSVSSDDAAHLKPMLAGLLSGGGHCRTCLADRLCETRFPLYHPCFSWRDALLQVARNFEQYASKEKVKHGEGPMSDPMPLTNVSNWINPNTGEAHCGDPGLYSVFGPRFWGRRRSMF